MSYFKEAVRRLSGDREVVAEAEDEAPRANADVADKGLFGGRQCKFKQDVYSIPSKPRGDVSQPTGILTQEDLENYVLFRKGDRLSFRYKEGTSGNCCYTAERNGGGLAGKEIKWTDALIQELIDEGALELL